MRRLLVVAGLLLLGMGCVPCGTFHLSDTLATNYEGLGYNGTWHEDCGAILGTSGSWNLFGDGTISLDFMPSAAGDRDWLGIDIEMGAAFPATLLEEGATVTTLTGGAFLNPGTSLREDEAALTGGTVEVLGVTGLDDVCADDGPIARLRWDLTWGTEGGPRYEARGTDRVLLSNFLSEDCPSGW